jgi:mannopine transport system permease protein
MKSASSQYHYLGTRGALLLSAPLILLLVVLFVFPLLLTLWNSVDGAHLRFNAYATLMHSTLFLKVLRNTFDISFTATLVSLLFGYPVALHLARQSPRVRVRYMMLIMLPFWTSILVKSFALTVLLGHDGLVNKFVHVLFGPSVTLTLMFNRVGAVVGMVNYLLPFMVFSILGSLLKQDENLVKAAEVMGAGSFRIFRKVTLPLSMPGVMAGVVINITLSIGMYITPALLGGRQDMMIANLIDFYTHQTLNWQMASAVSIVLLVISGALVAVLARVQGANGMGAR